MTFPNTKNPGPATQSTGNVAGGPYGAWVNSAGTALIGPTGGTVVLGGGPGGGVALYDGANSITSGTAQFSNSNGVSFGFNGQTITASVVTTYTQTVQTQASGAIAGSGFTTATTAGTAIVGTHNSAGLNLGVPKYLTTQTAQSGISSVVAGGSTQTVGMVSFANSNGVTFGLSTGALSGTITASVVGGNPGISGIADSANTQTVGTLSFANSNGITFGISTGANTATLTASVNFAGLLSNINISAGTTSSNVSAVTFSNANGVSFGYDGTNVTGSVKTANAGTGTTFAGVNVSGSMTLNTNGLNLSLSGGAGGGANPTTVSFYENYHHGNVNVTAVATNNTLGAASLWVMPFVVSAPVSFYRGMMMEQLSTAGTVITYPRVVSNSQGSSTASGSQGDTFTAAIYTRVSTGTNANSSNLITYLSNTWTRSFGVGVTYSNATNASTCSATVSYAQSIGWNLANMDSAGGVTSGSVTYGASSSASTSSTAQTTVTTTANYVNPYGWSGLSAAMIFDLPLSGSFSPGEYWLGIGRASATTTSAFLSGGPNAVTMLPALFGIVGTAQLYNYGISHTSANASAPNQGLGRSFGSGGTSTTFAVSSGTDVVGVNPWFAFMAQTK
jgi:hypothetical protein